MGVAEEANHEGVHVGYGVWCSACRESGRGQVWGPSVVKGAQTVGQVCVWAKGSVWGMG